MGRLDEREPEYNAEFNDQYSHAFFWAVSVTTGVGRDVEPYTPLEVGFTSAMVVAGLCAYIIIIGKVTALLASMNTVKSERTAKLDSVLRFCDRSMVPKHTVRKIHAYFDFMWSVDGDLQEMDMIEMLPEPMQIEVAMSTFKRIIQNMPVLDGISSRVMFEIVKSLVREMRSPKDVVYFEGEDTTGRFPSGISKKVM